MSDFDTTELAKVSGGGFLASLFTLFIQRLFTSQDKSMDKVLARLDILNTGLATLSQQVAVLLATNDRWEKEINKLEVQVTEHNKQLARLETLILNLSEGK